MKERKVVGFFRQILILLWKNGVLFKRNISGTIVEIAVALLFVFILVFLRFFVDSTKVDEQTYTNNPIRNVLQFINVTTNRSLIMYYPNNSYVQSIVTNAYMLIKSKRPTFNATITGSSSSEAGKLGVDTISNLFALISFPDTFTNASGIPNEIKYKIHTQERTTFQYNVANNFYSKIEYMFSNSPESYCYSTKYTLMYNTIFNPIKNAIDMSLISVISGISIFDLEQIKIAQFNCPGYDNDIFKSRFSFFPLVIIQISFLFTLIVTLGNIIVEKQTKMKEYLKLVGIKSAAMWITWIIRSIIPYLILCVLFTIVCSCKFSRRIKEDPNTDKAVFYHTNFFVGFSVFFVYAVQVSMFTLMIGQIFSKTFIAKTFAILFWLVTVINFYDNLPSSIVKYVFCMFPNSGLIFAFQVIFQYERSGKSLTYIDLYNNIFDDSMNLGAVLAAMIGWTLIYIPITWYIERIFPGEYGAPLPFYFPFMPSYWRTPKDNNDSNFDSVLKERYGFEKDPSGLNLSISIQNISKKFRYGISKSKTVVDNVSLNFYENQITGLLGHNGAGKTTTTFMLCGIYAPSSGDARILGKSIKTNMNDIRSSLGFCPQYDILYDNLTVAEHIKLFAKIKGYSRKEIKEEIVNISTLVGLENDLEKKSKQLSGGMKRRLSVALALTGGSKVIILDEPTSGLDPYNRRSLWELIQKFKDGRCIVLTTHFMEEADVLSDRIAIMNHGQIKCCGSPLFLKNVFGSGYRLFIAKNSNFDDSKFTEFLKKNVEKYSIESNIAAEISVGVPYGVSSRLPELLKNIESSKSVLGIDGYGVSSPTIEEIFIKIGSIDKNEDAKEDTKELDDADLIVDNNELSNVFSSDYKKNSGIILWFEQLGSLWIKRFRIFYRRFILAIVILILPFLLEAILSGLIPSETNLINSIRGVVSNYGSYDLTLKNYSTQTIPYYLKGSVDTTQLSAHVKNHFSQSKIPGVTLSQLDNDLVNEHVLSLRKSDIKNMLKNYYVGMSLNLTNTSKLSVTGYFSSLAFHSSANLINEIDNLVLTYLTNDPTRSIKTENVPLAANNTLSGTSNFLELLACIDSLPVSLLNFINSIIIALMIGIMVLHVGREKVNGSKQLQMLSGINPITYWLSHYIFDLIIHLINISLIVIALKIVDSIKNDKTSEINAIAGNETLGYFFLLLLISCLSWSLYAYVWSFFFKSEIIGFVVLVIVLGFASFLDIIWTFVELLIINGGKTRNIGADFMYALKIIFALVFPNVTVKRGLYNLKIRSNSYCVDAVNQVLAMNISYNQTHASFIEPGIGMELLFSGIQFVVMTLVLIVLETKLYSKLKCSRVKKATISSAEPRKLESEVEKEIKRIKNAEIDDLKSKEPLVVNQLYKKFKKNKTEFVAVDGLSFGVGQKECFGLLGLNGAGKTTTFKMLTGEIDPTGGKAYINGNEIVEAKAKVRRDMSFCPQFDYLPEYLTVEDTFRLFAGLKGLERKTINKVLNDLISVFKIEEFRDKLVQNLSGGNKRKVSSGLAFIGRPSVIFLDEPTTGMDPAARRYLWTVIKKARDMGLTIVLTTHSMEECEALSTRLGIMVNGQFKCLGSVQQLKNKYGKGYTLIIKCRSSGDIDSQVSKLEQFVSSNIKFSKLKDRQQDTLFYQIETDENIVYGQDDVQTIADLFNLLEKNKENLKIETYSLSQTTLEQVFLSFAREQKNEDQITQSKNNFKVSDVSIKSSKMEP
nr:ATP-binding cassette subfamily A3-like 2 [Brachionus rubens]